MISKLSNKINVLTSDAKLLVVGDVSSQIKDTIDKYFLLREFMDLTVESLEILNNSLYNQFDIVVFCFDKKSLELYLNENDFFPENSLVIIDDESYLGLKEHINKINTVLLSPIDEELFINRVYSILCISELDKLLKTKEKVIEKYKSNDENEGIDNFLDQYSGQIMFINDDLNEYLNKLKDLEFSREIFKSIGFSLIELSKVLERNGSLTNLSKILYEFGKFLDDLELEEIDPSRYEAFDYLTNMIDDLTLYIDELFVYKLFKNVRVFEDSVKNNIEYFKSQLLGKNEENEDNLEFF